MIQKSFITKLRSMYDGDDLTSILPSNIKKCRQKNIMNQLPKFARQKYEMKGCIKKASKIIHDYVKPEEIEINKLKDNIQEWLPEKQKGKKTKRKLFPKKLIIEEEKEMISTRTRRNFNKINPLKLQIEIEDDEFS